MKPAAPAKRWSPMEVAGLVLVLAAAALPRFYQLSEAGVWCDEGYFWRMATHPTWFQTLLHTMVDDVYPPLYFLIIHALSLFTASIFWLRLPGVLAGIAGAAAVFLFLRRWAGPRAAFFGGVLAALSPVLVYYCQEMKMYAVLALWLWLLVAETWACLEDPKRGWKRLTLWAVLSAYTFYLALVLWCVLLTLAAWRLRKDLSRGRSLWKGYAVAGVLFLPWMPFFLKSVAVGRPAVMNMLLDRVLFLSFENYSLGFWTLGTAGYVGLALFAAAIAIGFWRSNAPQRRFLGFLAGVTFLPLAGLWVFSIAGKPLYTDRAMLVCALAWVALAGYGLSRLPGAAAWIGLAVLAGLNIHALHRYYTDPACQRPNLRPAWDYVVSHWQSGDTIFHADSTQTYYPFKFFALQEARQADSPYKDEPGAAFQKGSARVPGVRPNWTYQEQQDFNPSASAGFFRQTWRKINAWLGEHGSGIYAGFNRDHVDAQRVQTEALPGVHRVWYLNWTRDAGLRNWLPQMNGYAAGIALWQPFEPEKMAWLEQGFRPVDEQQVGDVTVYLFEAKTKKGGQR